MTVKIIARNLSAHYQHDTTTIDVFKRVNFEMRAGEIFALFGPNGCGKTTLLNCLAGLHELSAGKVEFEGTSANCSFAILPQNFRESFFEWASLMDNILLMMKSPFDARKNKKKHIQNIADELSVKVDLTLRPSQCSGGMLQQAAIIRAFAVDPKFVFADEPFSALDVNIAGSLRSSVLKYVKRRQIIFVTVMHNLEDIVSVADRVLVIPKRPYSTDSILESEHSIAEIISNRSLITNVTGESASFVDRAKQMLNAQVAP